MKKIIYSLILAVMVLASCTPQRKQDKQEAKSFEEVKECAQNCVRSFIECLYNNQEAARDYCYAYNMTNGTIATLYDIASQQNVAWNPADISISSRIDTICNGEFFKCAIVQVTYHQKDAYFLVGFDKGLVDFENNKFFITGSELAGTEGNSLILDCKGFLPDNKQKGNLKIDFSEDGDLIRFLLQSESSSLLSKADKFMKAAKNGKVVYDFEGDEDGKIISKYLLTDSLQKAHIVGVDYKYTLNDVLKLIKEKNENLWSLPCSVNYSNGITLFFKWGGIEDTRGLFDYQKYCRNTCGDNPNILHDVETVRGIFNSTDLNMLEEIRNQRNHHELMRDMEEIKSKL